MLRVRTIYAGSAVAAANYYTRYLTDSPGEVPGVWSGNQADELGLFGQVEGADLLAMLEGRDPITGTRLGRAFHDCHRANGKVYRGGRWIRPDVLCAEVGERAVGAHAGRADSDRA